MGNKVSEALKGVCPKDCTVEILPTRRRGNIRLVVVKYPSETINERFDIDDWAIEKIHLLHHDKVRPLLQPAGAFRTIYCCGNRFVFYSPQCGVFSKFDGHLGYEGYGDMEYQKYVGNCTDINEVITYLTTRSDVFF